MATIIYLMIIGLLLIALEVFVPGMILGILGGLVLLGSCVTAYKEYGVLLPELPL